MPEADLDELRRLSVPAHDIKTKNSSNSKTRKSEGLSLRQRLKPIEVTDYHAVIREIERKERRRRVRREILQETKKRNNRKKYCGGSILCFFMSFIGVLLAIVAAAMIYVPEFQSSILSMITETKESFGL